MNYYLDTEFIEDFYEWNWIFKKKTRLHYIDLISIALAAEDGREYYAVSKDFDLKYVWNKYDLQLQGMGDPPKKIYWLRENVLRPIFNGLLSRRSSYEKSFHANLSEPFTYKTLKYLIQTYGKTNEEIAAEIQTFTAGLWDCTTRVPRFTMPTNSPQEIERYVTEAHKKDPPIFYAYYADYDWVLFCSLFGRMIDLPKGYPMYCRDLQQMMDELIEAGNMYTFQKQKEGLHNALADARWNRQVHTEIIRMRELCMYPTTQIQK